MDTRAFIYYFYIRFTRIGYTSVENVVSLRDSVSWSWVKAAIYNCCENIDKRERIQWEKETRRKTVENLNDTKT